VDIDGRHQVTYPVEDGLLCSFAAQAAQQADLPHVLLIDEINRGNLPRIFGELLYLLEYRGQAVETALLATTVPPAGQPVSDRHDECH
jgi:5-methylcytosine-specific restriction protein B